MHMCEQPWPARDANVLSLYVYDLCTTTGDYHLLKDGSDDQPDLTYKYPNEEIRELFKDS